MKIIQDPIHGSIKIEDWLLKIIDTPPFQRLRRISQLGFANLVYPGANHTRFEHSLGTMHIAEQLVEKINDVERVKREIIASALLHDIGHPPFSHSTEHFLREYLKITHEDVRDIIKGSEIKDILKEEGLRINKILDHIKGKSDYNIVSGDIDSDRMDYLVRDSYYTGVAYGIFDLGRLINKIYFEGKKLVIDSGGLKAAESLLVSRFMMNPTVYFHHVCRIAIKMYEKALRFCIEKQILDPLELRRMDDIDMISFLRKQEGYPSEIVNLLDCRRLFKRAIYVSLDRIKTDVTKINPERAEEEIASTAGIDEKYVIVDIPKIEEPREVRALVNIDGQILSLEEISPLVRSLKAAYREVLKLGVYTKKKYLEKVAKVALNYFNVEKIPKQKRLDEIIRI